MNHCRDCKHFNLKSPLSISPWSVKDQKGWCRCESLEGDGSPLAELQGDGMYEGVSLYVSPDFGCVQFEER